MGDGFLFDQQDIISGINNPYDIPIPDGEISGNFILLFHIFVKMTYLL